eukprot:TRINITY_DN16254_c0_g1_i8.p1 TRINITY_DN16254_c0_g1~~TRINITY_DN16254_c0_g1_i8.p1  ORF type:complete len:265 (-),score=55.34 TRINITY_DN16254_c0_g1_i8:469-1263(-)
MSVLCSNANAADEFLRRREDMNDQERLLYFKDITGRRPFKLELLRWSHARGDTTSQPVETRSASATSAIAIQEETDEVLERVLYGEWPLQPGEQTECLEGGDPEGVEVCTRLSSSASAADFDVVVCAAAELDQEDDEEVQERHCFQQLECLTGPRSASPTAKAPAGRRLIVAIATPWTATASASSGRRPSSLVSSCGILAARRMVSCCGCLRLAQTSCYKPAVGSPGFWSRCCACEESVSLSAGQSDGLPAASAKMPSILARPT